MLTAMTAFWCERLGGVGAERARELRPRRDRDVGARVRGRHRPRGPHDARPARRDGPARVHRARPARGPGLRGVRAGPARSTRCPRPAGLELADALPEPIFTPSTKAEVGHDVNISFDDALRAGRASGSPAGCATCASRSSTLAAERVAAAGLVLADTKFELGVLDGELVAVRRGRDPGLVADLAGSTRSSAARRRPPSTSSPSATGSPPSPGTARRRRRACRRRGRRDVASLRRGVRARDRSVARRLVRCRSVRFDARVEVTLREGIADPEGATIERALPALGFAASTRCVPGAPSAWCRRGQRARRTRLAQSLADRLLANPVIEPPTSSSRRLMPARVGVVVFPGTNCEYDAATAFAGIGADVRYVWHHDAASTASTSWCCRAGSPTATTCGPARSHGSRWSCSRSARFAAAGGTVLGICNGFQVLCEAGLLPGALQKNAGSRSCASRWSSRWPRSARR